MRLNSNRLKRRQGRHSFERTLTAGWLAITLSIIVAAPFSLAQNSNQPDTAPGAAPGDSVNTFKRRNKFMQGDMQGADSGDMSPDMIRRQRMRKAIMRARQMEGADSDQVSEPFNRGQLTPNDGSGPGLGRKGRGQFMPDGGLGTSSGTGAGAGFGPGAGGGRRGFAGRAEFGRGGMGRGGFGGGKAALDLTPLNLTEEQKGKIQQMRAETANRVREVRRKMQSGGQELKDMMFDPSVSDDTIRAKGRELRKLHEQAEDMKLNDFLSIRGVLTADQRKLLPNVKPGGPRAAMVGGSGPGNTPSPPPGSEPVPANQ